jgi:ABC-type nickel/cobalt efflux system permease component RcnA
MQMSVLIENGRYLRLALLAMLLLTAAMLMPFQVRAQQSSDASNPLTAGSSANTSSGSTSSAAASPFGTPAQTDTSSAPAASPAAVETAPAETAPVEAAPSDVTAAAPGLLRRLGVWVVTQQRFVNRIINTQLAAIKRGDDSSALWGGLLIAFLYGVFHALGPGHGKTVIAGYFLGHQAGWGRGVAMACWMAISHVLAAIGIVLVVHFILSHSFATPVDEMMWLRFVSYGAIVLIGLAMLIGTWRGKAVLGCSHDHGAACAHDHHGHDHHAHAHAGHGHGGNGRDHGHTHTISLTGNQSLLAIAAGFVPCSGAILILVFCLTNSLIWQGVVMTLMIAFGMAATLSVIGLGSILLRRQTLGRVSDSERASRLLGYIGPVLITLIGVLLLGGAFLDPTVM